MNLWLRHHTIHTMRVYRFFNGMLADDPGYQEKRGVAP